LRAPARYVSGYYLRTDRQEQDAGHAWAEAHVEGLGWVGFDPAHGVCMTERHVRVAVGPDYLEAAPARGAQVGGADEVLAVKVNVAQGRGLIEG
jgi:transglutaminase-like putative cysteine protease